jgi:hypothetical protein
MEEVSWLPDGMILRIKDKVYSGCLQNVSMELVEVSNESEGNLDIARDERVLEVCK